MPEKIFILRGPIRSGKTTTLMQWSAGRKDVLGILTPVIDGKRFFMNAQTKEQFEMEAEPGEKNIFTIGRFVFSKRSFEKAINILSNALKEKSGWLVVDEIGPLELKGEGFDPVIKSILSSDTRLDILFVVRDSAVEKVKEHYNIEPSIITQYDVIFKK